MVDNDEQRVALVRQVVCQLAVHLPPGPTQVDTQVAVGLQGSWQRR